MLHFSKGRVEGLKYFWLKVPVEEGNALLDDLLTWTAWHMYMACQFRNERIA